MASESSHAAGVRVGFGGDVPGGTRPASVIAALLRRSHDTAGVRDQGLGQRREHRPSGELTNLDCGNSPFDGGSDKGRNGLPHVRPRSGVIARGHAGRPLRGALSSVAPTRGGVSPGVLAPCRVDSPRAVWGDARSSHLRRGGWTVYRGPLLPPGVTAPDCPCRRTLRRDLLGSQTLRTRG